MARKKDTPQKAALREMMGNYLKENNVTVKDRMDVNSIMRDMMSIILEGALDQEMDEELGYSKYDYRNKETDNSRNGHSQKIMHTSYGDMENQIRNTTKFVSYKELKPLMADLKRVYAAPTEEIARAELDGFDEKWNGKYPVSYTHLTLPTT